MTTTSAAPDLRELVLASRAVAAVPGLAPEALAWQGELPAVRRRLQREAHRLATPRIWPDTLAGMARTGRRVLGAAAPDAPAALLAAAAGGVGLPIGPPSSSDGAIRRAERVVRAGGPAYVKLGQFIASSQGLLPAEWVEAFAWCRDDAPKLRRGVARSIAERSLAKGLLADFDDAPLAAGSIGQVHRATLRDGTAVVVKVRRPGLRARFRRDVETLAWVAAGAERVSGAARSANLRGFVELFAELSLHELDFRLEALNAVEGAAVLEHAGIDRVHVPLPVAGGVTERVIVMPFVPGVSYDRAAVEFGADLAGDQLVHTAIHAVLASTLVYGVSHGDLHAGNVLVPAPDRFNLLDFGICARFSDRERALLMQFLVAFAVGDADGQVDALAGFGAFGDDDLTALRTRLREQVDELQQRAHGPVTFDRLGENLGRLLRTFAASGFAMPRELVLFFKNLMYLSSFASVVAPRTDLFEAVAGVVQELVAAHPGLFGQEQPA